MKPSQKLTRPAGETIPGFTIFVDTETRVAKSTLKSDTLELELGCYEVWQSGKRIKQGTFYDAADFWAVVKRNLRCRVIAHNWQFDAAVLGVAVNREPCGYHINMERSIVPVEPHSMPPFLMRLEFPDDYAELVCFTNWFRMPLAKIGEFVGLPKWDMPTEYKGQRGTIAYELWLQQLEAYCQRDVEILRNGYLKLCDFVQEHGHTSPGITAASAAYRMFTNRFLTPDVRAYGNRKNAMVTKAEMTAYKGGRSDVFFDGTPEAGDCYKYDVNSMYPSCMLEPVPVRYVQRYPAELAVEHCYVNSELILLADVTVDYQDNWGFPDGYRDEDGMLLFPNGKCRAWVWQPALEMAIKDDALVEVHAAFAYKAEPLFTEFIEYFYNIRQRFKELDNDAGNAMAKQILNSLYGKFGQRETGDWHKLNPDSDEYAVMVDSNPGTGRAFKGQWDDEFRDYCQLGTDLYRYVPGSGNPAIRAIPSIAGYITCLARARLAQAIRQVPGTVYLCDTDSMITDCPLPDDMIHPTELGKWKLESIQPASASEFVAPKYYRHGDWVIRGITDPEFGQGAHEQTVFPKFTTGMLKGRDEPRIDRLSKTTNPVNLKRISNGYGLPNIPIVLS